MHAKPRDSDRYYDMLGTRERRVSSKVVATLCANDVQRMNELRSGLVVTSISNIAVHRWHGENISPSGTAFPLCTQLYQAVSSCILEGVNVRARAYDHRRAGTHRTSTCTAAYGMMA